MDKTIDRVIDICAYVVGTALDLTDQVREYVPSMLASLASSWQALGKHLANLANRAVYLATALVSCIVLAYMALKPVYNAQIRAGTKVMRQGCMFVRVNAPMLLKRSYERLRAKVSISEKAKKIRDYAVEAWQFRKECLA